MNKETFEILSFTPAPIGWYVEYELPNRDRLKLPMPGWLNCLDRSEIRYYAAIHNDFGSVLPAIGFPDGKMVNIANARHEERPDTIRL